MDIVLLDKCMIKTVATKEACFIRLNNSNRYQVIALRATCRRLHLKRISWIELDNNFDIYGYVNCPVTLLTIVVLLGPSWRSYIVIGIEVDTPAAILFSTRFDPVLKM